MTDLDIVIKHSKLMQLKTIANLSAVVALEVDPYIRMAFYVEQYLDSPTNELLGLLHESLTDCAKRYPDFQPYHTRLITELKSNGNLSVTTPSTQSTNQVDVVSPVIMTKEPPPTNIINLFGKVPVDKLDNI